jgi:serine/threonine protein kinase
MFLLTEMIRGEKHSYPADIWSMGICLLELMHGYPPNRDNKLRALFLAGAGVAPSLVAFLFRDSLFSYMIHFQGGSEQVVFRVSRLFQWMFGAGAN